MLTRKIAVTRTIKNDETVLRVFSTKQKQEALDYGESAAKSNAEGVIACIEAASDENGKINNKDCRVYKIWD